MAHDFEALKARVRDISYTPGTDALRHISPLLLQAQDLTATALVRLSALDNSTYTSVASSRAGLELMASVVSSSSLAGTDLAHVVLANPYEGAQFAGYPADDEAVRTVRHAEAIPKMNGHLDDAVHQLDLCAIGCHYLAHGITEDLTTAHKNKPAAVQQTTGPALTAAQYDALTALNGGGYLYESATRGLGVTRVATSNGTRVSIATYRALERRGLVTHDTSTSLWAGRAEDLRHRAGAAGPGPAAPGRSACDPSGRRAQDRGRAGSPPVSGYGPDDRVLVSPRYMAGAGDRLADAIGPLIHLFGWPPQHDAATGHVKIDSPDGGTFVDFDPVHPLGQWWTITHHEPYWEVQFSRQAPLEAVAAVTQALPQLLGDTRHADRIPVTDMPPDQLATLHLWTVEDRVLTSPDGYCQLIHTPDEDIAWRAWHAWLYGLPDAPGPVPTALDELLQSLTTARDPNQQHAVLAQLAEQLRNAAEILEWARNNAHWRQLPTPTWE